MNNKEIASLLKAIAAAYEVKGESRFKVIAYERASTAVEHASSEVKDLWDDKQLQTVPGIGTSIASHLDELFKTGKVKHFEQVVRGLPSAMFEFLEIPGIGAKTAWKLCEKLKIKDSQGALLKLEQAAKKGKIKVFEGFGEESEKNILEGIEELRRWEGRILLPYAWRLAKELIEYMKREKSVLRIDPLGSLRRMASTVGDIDLAVATKDSPRVIDHFVKFPQAKEILAKGKNTARLILRNGYQVDLKTQKPSAYGAMLQHFTGSKHHNIHLREIALKKKMSLSEYGIKKKAGRGWKLMEFDTEKKFYQALGMDWIPPELREDTGEIEAALLRPLADQGKQHKLPKLLKLTDIKGDLHLHSDFSVEPSHDPGNDSMEEMIKKGKDLGYEYLAFSEHNPSLSQHTPKQIISILKRKKDKIDKINYSSKKNPQNLKIFNSLEIDIRPNGELAIPQEGLKALDFAIVAVHGSFKMSRKKMSLRVLRALAHPKVKILAHPTGRMLGQREGYELEWEKIFQFCLKNQKVLEINAHPKRLDLPDVLVKEAVKIGVKIVIGSDAHSLEEMGLMKYGVSVARRGWTQKGDVLNTLKYDKIIKWLVGKGGEK
jgi:DNA polymerase (family 10)